MDFKNIPMSSKNYELWQEALEMTKPAPNDFIYFIDCLSEFDWESGEYNLDKIFPEFRRDSRRVMMAWLFPELIIVEE